MFSGIPAAYKNSDGRQNTPTIEASDKTSINVNKASNSPKIWLFNSLSYLFNFQQGL